MRFHRRRRTTKLTGLNPDCPKGCGGAGQQLWRSSSPMSGIALVAASRSCSGGVRNATHAMMLLAGLYARPKRWRSCAEIAIQQSVSCLKTGRSN